MGRARWDSKRRRSARGERKQEHRTSGDVECVEREGGDNSGVEYGQVEYGRVEYGRRRKSGKV